MVDITHKIITQRTATAQAIVKVGSFETIEAIKNKTVPKGDVLEVARTAGLFAVKNTSNAIPDCHPLPIEYTAIAYDIKEMEIYIEITVKTIYKTGVEVEAMHGASIVALTMYDMLKPLDKGVEISSIKLESKKGGKTDFKDELKESIRTAVIVCSDSVAAGTKEDSSGKAILQKLEQHQLKASVYEIIPDEFDVIQANAKKYGIDPQIFAKKKIYIYLWMVPD